MDHNTKYKIKICMRQHLQLRVKSLGSSSIVFYKAISELKILSKEFIS